MQYRYYQFIGSILLLCTSCGSYFNQPVAKATARLGEDTEVTPRLSKLPPPVEPIVAAVYKFRDQTGQYKPTEAGSTFSTAVTQGATTILIKALEDSKWFVPIERENLSNLLNERNIIRSTRKEYNKNVNEKESKLPPLLYAGIILEGGIVSYDSNIITGGLGARYLGIGGSTQYRQDRITVYLRAVSTSSGKILKTVYVSKTILSQALDASFFRYVSFRKLLEAETGYTKNEPAQLAVSEAVEKAVEALIIEGVSDDLWKVKAEPEVVKEVITSYRQEQEEAKNTGLYDRYFKERRGKKSLFAKGGMALITGDLKNAKPSYSVGIGGKWFLNPYLNLGASFSKFGLKNENVFSEGFHSIHFDAEMNLLPFEQLSPFVIAGAGVVNSDAVDRSFFSLKYGGGMEYLVKDHIGIAMEISHNIVLGDGLDNVKQGKRGDQYYNFSLGLNWYLGAPLKRDKKLRLQQQKELRQLRKRNKEVIKNKTIPIEKKVKS